MSKEYLEKVVTFLSSNGIGTIGNTLFAHILPTQPADAVSVYLAGGNRTPGDPIRQKILSVYCRTTNPASGMSRINTIYFLLNDVWNVLSCYEGRFFPRYEPGPYFRDPNDIMVYTLDFVFTTTRQK